MCKICLNGPGSFGRKLDDKQLAGVDGHHEIPQYPKQIAHALVLGSMKNNLFSFERPTDRTNKKKHTAIWLSTHNGHTF